MTPELIDPPVAEAVWSETTTIELPDRESQLADVVQHIMSRMTDSDSRKRAFDITVPGTAGEVVLFHAELCNRLRERGLYAWHREQGLIVAFPPKIVPPEGSSR